PRHRQLAGSRTDRDAKRHHRASSASATAGLPSNLRELRHIRRFLPRSHPITTTIIAGEGNARSAWRSPLLLSARGSLAVASAATRLSATAHGGGRPAGQP